MGRVHLQPPRGIRDDLVEEVAVEDVEARAGPEQIGHRPRRHLVHAPQDLLLHAVEERDEGGVELYLPLEQLVVSSGQGAHVHGDYHVDDVELGQVVLHQLEHGLVLRLRKQPRHDHLVGSTSLRLIGAVRRHGRRRGCAGGRQLHPRTLRAPSDRLPMSAASPAPLLGRHHCMATGPHDQACSCCAACGAASASLALPHGRGSACLRGSS
mmetsp:Transcript_110930/g.353692  ORF Transcript_110930/g.353692 Transcript_110930/m.353692 type:complete len:211 (-) Transcript_110930:298-930(-)